MKLIRNWGIGATAVALLAIIVLFIWVAIDKPSPEVALWWLTGCISVGAFGMTLMAIYVTVDYNQSIGDRPSRL